MKFKRISTFLGLAAFSVVALGLLIAAFAAPVDIVGLEAEDGLQPSNSPETDDAASGQSFVRFVDPPSIASLRVGTTLTHDSADRRASSLWSSSIAPKLKADQNKLLNTHIHGFGMVSPAINQGRPYDYSSLDARMDKIRESEAETIVTLCCSPGWMNGSTEDYDFRAPLDEKFDEFAALSADVAQRYPDVEYFQVWNEMKGFFNGDLNRWDYERYTNLYNKVYVAVKDVRPDAKIGGPYVVMESWVSPPVGLDSEVRGDWGIVDQRSLDVVTYWLENAVGADFVAVDGGGCPTVSKNPTLTSCDGMTESERHGYFREVASWLDQQTDLPIWWSEVYPAILRSSGEDYKTQTSLDALDAFASGGGDVVLFWSEECNANTAYKFIALWSCDDGSVLPIYNALEDSPNYDF